MQTAQENSTNHALLSVSEASAYLGIPHHVIYKAIHSGLLVAEKQLGQWAIAQEALENYQQQMSLVSDQAIPDIQEITEEDNAMSISITPEVVIQPIQPIPQTTNHKTVQLRSGGTLTITYAVDLFQADKPELDMLLSIIATLKTYEATQDTSHV